MEAPAFAADELRRFKRENRWNMTSIVMGMTLSAWLRVLRERARDVNWLLYGHRVLALTVAACVNSLVSVVDWLAYGRAVSRQEVRDDPVFILGHPRTGTTLVYNLLAIDDASFIFPTTYSCCFPATCLTLRPLKRLVGLSLPRTRPMDNMELGLDMPQEDELGTTQLSGGVSTYMPLLFMTRAKDYFPLFTFERAAPGLLEAWRAGLLELLRKSALLAGGYRGRRMLLKSPPHTARIALLDRLFPRSSFIYIHRHPYEIFLSAANMAEKTYSLTYLDDPTDMQIQEFILSQFELLLDEYLRQRAALPPSRLLELRFDEFERDPAAGVRAIYAHFGWPMPRAAELETYCATLAAYQKNAFRELPDGLKRLVYRRWRKAFDVFGYEP